MRPKLERIAPLVLCRHKDEGPLSHTLPQFNVEYSKQRLWFLVIDTIQRRGSDRKVQIHFPSTLVDYKSIFLDVS